MTTKPRLSVLIPTANRSDILAATLAGFTRQDATPGSFELIVADNQPSDVTRSVTEQAASNSPFPIRYLEAPYGGPASARNAAAELAEGEIILLAGDDTEPARPDVIALHLRLHSEDVSTKYAVLGQIAWSPKNPPTDFMRWLEDGGPQFHFHSLPAGEVPASRYFYSSHLSMKKTLFAEVGGFDERFPFAAVEDTELGVRLEDRGVRLEYRPELLFYHDHPTTLDQSLQRAVTVGRAAAIYNRIRPDRPHPQIQAPSGFRWRALLVLAPMASIFAKVPLPTRSRHYLWLAMHRARYALGYSREIKA